MDRRENKVAREEWLVHGALHASEVITGKDAAEELREVADRMRQAREDADPK